MKKQIKMKDIIYKNPPAPPLNEGFMENAITGILKFLYSNKINAIKKELEPVNKDLSKKLEHLKATIDDINKDLDDQKTIEAFKRIGIDITTWPRLKR
jgi:hypothetical protein